MNSSSIHLVGDKVLADIIQHVKPPQFEHDFTKPFLITFLVFLCLASLFANGLIIHVVRVNKYKRMRTTANYFIINMAFGDILVAMCITAVTIKYLHAGLEWSDGVLGQFTCKMVYYVEIVSILCSVFSLVAITLDRYLAVVHPFQYKCCSSWTKYIIPSVWIASLTLPAHLIIANVEVGKIDILNDNKTYVFALQATLEAAILASIGYVLPHVVMLVMYAIIAYKLWTRRVPGVHVHNNDAAGQVVAKKVTRMIVCILFVFNICWFPTFFMVSFVYFMPSNSEYHETVGLVSFSVIAIANGPLNAVIYAIFCQNFRAEFKGALNRLRFWSYF